MKFDFPTDIKPEIRLIRNLPSFLERNRAEIRPIRNLLSSDIQEVSNGTHWALGISFLEIPQ